MQTATVDMLGPEFILRLLLQTQKIIRGVAIPLFHEFDGPIFPLP